jgi:hypothetical protein
MYTRTARKKAQQQKIYLYNDRSNLGQKNFKNFLTYLLKPGEENRTRDDLSTQVLTTDLLQGG